MRLSHTAKEMYLTCPKKWELYYKEKLRSTQIGSALFFGAAIDEALNRMLLDKKKKLTEEEEDLLSFTPEQIFENYLKNVRVLTKVINISTSSQAMYYKSDLDISLLEPSDFKEVIRFANTLDINLENVGDVTEFVTEAQEQMKAGLDEDTQRVYNQVCWFSLLRKGYMLIEAYRTQIMPEIEEVFDVQKRISLPDGDDEFVGVIDLVCSFTSEPGVKYVCDNKTSSRSYKQDSVRTSEQLAAYSEYEGNAKCAYIVVEKKLRKREPRVRCNIIKDTMPTEMVDNTFDKLTDVFHGINEGSFDKDMEACFQYGRKCEYFQNCRTGDTKNLEYVKYKEKKDGNKKGTGGTASSTQGKTEGSKQEYQGDEI